MRRAVVTVAVLLTLAGGAVGAWWMVAGAGQARERAALDTAEAFLEAWQEGDWPVLAARVAPGVREQAVRAHREAFADLAVEMLRVEPLTVRIDEEVDAEFAVTLDVDGAGRLTYTGDLGLEWDGDAWTVSWTPAVVHPLMVPGGRFAQSRQWRPRAAILDRDGVPIAGGDGVVTVGIVPVRLADEPAAVEALVAHAGADRARVETLLARDDLEPEWFYPVAELPRARFDEVDPLLRPVPGIVFRTDDDARAASAFATHLVGRTGPATAEQAAEMGHPYREGDVVGQYGLEAGLEEQLAGRPDVEIAIVDADGSVVEVVHRVDGVEPRPARVTLDARVQAAADAALGLSGGEPAALVAVDVASAEILAAANRPATGFNRALEGRYPPGSTFKVVTAGALLGAGATPESALDCPAERRVGGRAFRNAGGIALGPVTLLEAFVQSCNTAFVGEAEGLDGALAATAEAFGFDGRAYLPLPSFGGSFPEPGDATELAAAAIGQGRVEASPLHMASVAAAVAHGQWRAPVLVRGEGAGEGADEPARALPGDAEALRAMMRATVASGTGAAAALPGEPVHGKTGSAEFGTASPPDTHAWFIGYRGSIAFAVLVEGGGAGGAVAAPIARAFLEALD